MEGFQKFLCGIYNVKWNFRHKISAIFHFALVNDGWILLYCVLIVFKNLVKLCRANDIFTKFQEVARKYIQLGPSLTSWSIGNKKGIYRPKQTRVYISQDVIDGLQYTVHSNLPLDVTLQGFQRLVLATVINADTGSFSLKTKKENHYFSYFHLKIYFE